MKKLEIKKMQKLFQLCQSKNASYKNAYVVR